jgi:preprotein translocase subunit SecE
MASKTALANNENGSLGKSKFVGGIAASWANFTSFLSDVRSEMRKVVTPSRKEVQVTTTVVIPAVFIFGVFFFVTDNVFKVGVNMLLHKLGGLQ